MSRQFQHVAMLMGGWSAEREVSLNSGRACGGALEREGYRVTYVDADRDVGARLAELKPDACFNALHGTFGEDGCVQGLLETLAIPYTHSGVLASALAMHKERAKIVMASAGVPVAESKVIVRRAFTQSHPMEPPYVIKPVAEGSSVGVSIVQAGSNASPAALVADKGSPDDDMMVERYVPGRELTCSVMGEQVFGVTEIIPQMDLRFYDYQAKYADGGSKHLLPAQISPNIYHYIQRLTLAAHQALGCRGVSRADFRFDEQSDGTNELICLEVNTQPGMTATSLVPELAAHAGLSFGELVRWIVEDASCSR